MRFSHTRLPDTVHRPACAIPRHLDVHVAAARDPIGGLLGVESFVAAPRGYKATLEWMGAFGTVSKVSVEGTGAYGAGLGRFLRRADIEVIEVDRPNLAVEDLREQAWLTEYLSPLGWPSPDLPARFSDVVEKDIDAWPDNSLPSTFEWPLIGLPAIRATG